jgi:hypothetical protein
LLGDANSIGPIHFIVLGIIYLSCYIFCVGFVVICFLFPIWDTLHHLLFGKISWKSTLLGDANSVGPVPFIVLGIVYLSHHMLSCYLLCCFCINVFSIASVKQRLLLEVCLEQCS